ncbi:2-hydroxychromene-2-carboxylate isomerase [Roseinatronobacter bogoriensis]|uniref:2-hydroxychromene-2-carboxylate isomerase n=1 Tax=Roseinatronobacter bogoriensis subsp. barguzinensis TaxID=441209 RepID=A0A2K8KF66_9RHOB|nr:MULTISPECIES: 2-hydroxychromene-2-carboxylate isomerase [Rhodobaca]ATX64790.1 2-hydroxychromene-2-carboxylate isomerase [Rhodobaca barguzinensis]MBB4208574.1 2-hydroxychromene-2-carboxylate isomerase [Rhodobaca bogoriensis DSM 18756]TDW38157.1 2-hydroxychromene-2-carboxylate isomerase [Rhodobaca barguzinensis]TDY69672.1 2-hydroxychromene-2-carboxylate isomerase [Rhodobaca bogoriensis DSM 18756]
MAHIDYYLSPMSPWVHMAGTRPARIAQAAGATLRYKPLDPSALFHRTGGKVLADRHESRKAYRLQELQRWSDRLGVPIKLQPAFFPTNPAPASYAIIAAQETGGGDMAALVTGLSRACWEEDRNIAEDEVIRDCLSAAGFDPSLAFSGMLQGAEIYPRNLEDAVEQGVFGVPFFVMGEARFWGQDRLDFLAEAAGVQI